VEDRWTKELPWLGQYVLDENGDAVPAKGLLSWAQWMEEYSRHLGDDQIGTARVSTIFLGLDMRALRSLNDDPLYKPLLWETMIFGGPYDQQCWRYTSKEEALEGHRRAVQMLTS
jgi:hypothetical protein